MSDSAASPNSSRRQPRRAPTSASSSAAICSRSSTVVDGFHRSHRYQVVSDAVACRRQGIGDAASYKLALVRVIGNYAGVIESAELIEISTAIVV